MTGLAVKHLSCIAVLTFAAVDASRSAGDRGERHRGGAGMTRVPRLGRDQLGEAQRARYDAIIGGPRAASRTVPLVRDDGSLEGPACDGDGGTKRQLTPSWSL